MAYDKAKGYADVDDIDFVKLDTKLSIAWTIIKDYLNYVSSDQVLVAGCGAGDEAVRLSHITGLRTVGIDIAVTERRAVGELAEMIPMDLAHIAFPEETFKIVYSYHVLEHVPDPIEVVRQIHRVMKKGGILYIGFPNRNRMVGYLGHHNNVSLGQTILWNLRDYKHRLLFRFENRLGAHAGFTDREFHEIADNLFESVVNVAKSYMVMKYPRYRGVLELIAKTGLDEFIFPSQYYICTK